MALPVVPSALCAGPFSPCKELDVTMDGAVAKVTPTGGGTTTDLATEFAAAYPMGGGMPGGVGLKLTLKEDITITANMHAFMTNGYKLEVDVRKREPRESTRPCRKITLFPLQYTLIPTHRGEDTPLRWIAVDGAVPMTRRALYSR